MGVHIRKPSNAGTSSSLLSGKVGMKAVELFSGCGGLALGTALAGFEHLAVIEFDSFACQTIKENQKRGHPLVRDWPLYEMDVRHFDYASLSGEVDLLCAGLPCQPFSFGGKAKAHRDSRDMFSEVVRAARELRPKAILIENVKGLLRSSFKSYFDYLLLALGSPGLARIGRERWRNHFDTLRAREDQGTGDDLKYDVHVHTINAADFGVPQWRERVLIVAFRSDLAVRWEPPQATHGLDELLWNQWRSGVYWPRHGLDRKRPGRMSHRLARRLTTVKEFTALPSSRLPWRTVRDAINDLPKPVRGDDGARNHSLRPGARAYEGHLGSLYDEPAKTLKAGTHGVPGGENSLALGGERLRYFTIRECARLQTFPDDYVISGPWTRAMRQLGNAVPVLLAHALTETIHAHLSRATPRADVLQFPSLAADARRVV
jgi:DNA (cytosine-5)-methyltransferase 1